MIVDDYRPPRPWDRTPVRERGYFDLLGPGVVAVVAGRPAAPPGAGGWHPPTGGAWIHVGEEGIVTAFTGKVEVGQGTHAALIRAVALDLGVPARSVRLVMGDTDLCPWDLGTFGSRSMPDALPPLRAAARALREEIDRRPGRSDRPSDLGARVRGLRTILERPPAAEGEPAPPPPPGPAATVADDPTVVTGARRYGSDLRPDGVLEGRVLRAPTYGARLDSVDTAPARALPGVVVVEEDGFVGVAADDRRDAAAALEAIRARWTAVPAPDEAGIEEYLRTHPLDGDHWDAAAEADGDLPAAWDRSAVRLTATYRTDYIAHVPLEPRAAVARWDGNRLSVWLGTQTPFRARDDVARGLGIPVDDVRIRVPPTGAGFGGKHGGAVALEAARLARAAGRPVRVRYSREEEFRFGYLRPLSLVDVRAGADAAGALTAWEFENVNGGAAALGSPYRSRARRLENRLARSPLPQGSYRSLAAVANNFAREGAIDELAVLLGRDPVAFRAANLDDLRLRRVLETAAARAGWDRPLGGDGRGRGIAIGREKDGRIATVAEVTVAPDRRVRVDRIVTVFEAGRVVDPDRLARQVEGATVMGLGGALFESIAFDPGAIRNPHLARYRVPRFSDLPEIVVELLDLPDQAPAGGGETPIIAVAPAIANALYAAGGVRLRRLPLLPTGRLPRPPAGPSGPG